MGEVGADSARGLRHVDLAVGGPTVQREKGGAVWQAGVGLANGPQCLRARERKDGPSPVRKGRLGLRPLFYLFVRTSFFFLA